MNKPFRQLSDYQLFFEEIGPNLNHNAVPKEPVHKQNDDYEKSPSLSEGQVRQLREDLRNIGGDKESPTI